MKRPQPTENIFKDLTSDNPKVKYGCAKRLAAKAEQDPDKLYLHFDHFVKMLDHEKQINRNSGKRSRMNN
jgi:hypothetical protein